MIDPSINKDKHRVPYANQTQIKLSLASNNSLLECPSEFLQSEELLLGGIKWQDCFTCAVLEENESSFQKYMRLSEPKYFANLNPQANTAILAVGGALRPWRIMSPLVDALHAAFGLPCLAINLPGNSGELSKIIDTSETDMIVGVKEGAELLRRYSGAKNVIAVGLSAGGKAILAAHGRDRDLFNGLLTISVALEMHPSQATKLQLGSHFDHMLTRLSKFVDAPVPSEGMLASKITNYGFDSLPWAGQSLFHTVSHGIDTFRQWLGRLAINLESEFDKTSELSEIELAVPYMNSAPAIHLLNVERLRHLAKETISSGPTTVPTMMAFATDDWIVNHNSSVNLSKKFIGNHKIPARISTYNTRHVIPADSRRNEFILDAMAFVAESLRAIDPYLELPNYESFPFTSAVHDSAA